MRLQWETFSLSDDAFEALFKGIAKIAVNSDAKAVKEELEKFGIKCKLVE